MIATVPNLNRRGISLTEILIGIMVLGIGVISLATLFPIGLLQMKRAVNNVRGTLVAQSAWNEVRIRNLLAPPFGPTADVFSRPPYWSSAAIPTSGSGVPIVIDPLGLLYAGGGPTAPDLFGIIDLNGDGTKDFDGGDGIPRVSGGFSSLLLAMEVFCSPDDLTFDDGERRMIPLQQVGGTVPYLSPTVGVPFRPGTLLRESRYSWMVVARKVNARQGLGPGTDGYPGAANTDDDGVNMQDDDGEYGYSLTDDLIADYGPDEIATNIAAGTISLDDPARDMTTGYPVPGPVGPFDVTIVAFYSRDFENRQVTFANKSSTVVPLRVFTAGSDVATLAPRSDGVQFPDIPLGSYVMDSTFDSENTVPDLATNKIGKRNGFVYRVVRKSIDASGNMVVELDQRAKDDGYALTVLRGAVGVFEKQVP
jgi:hypothetical protein